MIASFDMSERRGYRAMPKIAALYQIRNRVTDERYIGSTCDVHARARRHSQALRDGIGSPRLMDAVHTHGIEAFVFEVLEVLQGNYLDRERREYTVINSTPIDLLYNYIMAPHRAVKAAGGCDV